MWSEQVVPRESCVVLRVSCGWGYVSEPVARKPKGFLAGDWPKANVWACVAPCCILGKAQNTVALKMEQSCG